MKYGSNVKLVAMWAGVGTLVIASVGVVYLAYHGISRRLRLGKDAVNDEPESEQSVDISDPQSTIDK